MRCGRVNVSGSHSKGTQSHIQNTGLCVFSEHSKSVVSIFILGEDMIFK